jgi:hypothetical protein
MEDVYFINGEQSGEIRAVCPFCKYINIINNEADVCVHFSEVTEEEMRFDKWLKKVNTEDLLSRFKHEERIKDAVSMTRMYLKIEENKAKRRTRTFQAKCSPYLRKALPYEYSVWITGFIKAEGKPTHSYNYGMPDKFLVANDNFTLCPEYGSGSRNIIVPVGIKVEFKRSNVGHNNLYFMDEFKQIGDWVPVYKDTHLINEEAE